MKQAVYERLDLDIAISYRSKSEIRRELLLFGKSNDGKEPDEVRVVEEDLDLVSVNLFDLKRRR